MSSNACTACARNPCAGIDVGLAGDKDETMRTIDLHRLAKRCGLGVRSSRKFDSAVARDGQS
jgi:hypothetical protein